MTKHQIFQNLCSKDPRNPFFQNLYGYDEEKPVPRQDCSCDNCFSGKDKLAVELLKTWELLNTPYVFFACKHKALKPWEKSLDAWQKKIEEFTGWNAFDEITKRRKNS